MAFALGDPVRLELTKWGDHPHWAFTARWLGRDAHGDWIGIPQGTPMDRPGAHYEPPVPQVGLVPSFALPDDERGWLATFHAAPSHIWVYVDMTTPPVWDGSTVRAVDLDLDVIRGREGDVVVDDEDEFAEHRVSLGYPADVVSGAMASCDRVNAAVRDRKPPFDPVTSQDWLARFRNTFG